MTIELDLTGMTPGGDAIGRHEGMVVFVPLGLPGEKVEVELTEQRRSFARGRIMRVLESAPDRVSPHCRHFGICGGCQWQQIDYPAQLRFKTEIVGEQLTRIGKLDNPPVLDCIPSVGAYHYRNHARLAVAPSGRLGYRASASHQIVEIEECPILEEMLESKVVSAQKQRLKKQKSTQAKQKDYDVRWSTPTLRVGDYDYLVSPQSFFQANTHIAARMVDWALAALQLGGSEAVLDLYCGVGLFTLPIAHRAASVIGVEANASATADAKRNLALLNHKRPGAANILTASVADGLHQAEIASKGWGAILLDPPRAGVDEQALRRIVALQSPLILYVSCDPATLARDLHELIEAGYQLVSAQPFDMFPQTYHVETCCVLRKASPLPKK